MFAEEMWKFMCIMDMGFHGMGFIVCRALKPEIAPLWSWRHCLQKGVDSFHSWTAVERNSALIIHNGQHRRTLKGGGTIAEGSDEVEW